MKTKTYLITFTLLFPFFLGAQFFHINENFNSGSLPITWTNTAVSGTQTWNFGIDGASATGNQNIDSTAMAYFDDDFLGTNSWNNTVSLSTPVFDNSTSFVTNLEFDYNLRTYNGIADSFYVDVYDGAAWNRVFSESSDNCGNWLSCNSYPHAKINISAFSNANCQVRFTYHDGNDWGWYVGLDNVVISSPLPDDIGVTSILTPVSTCGLSASEVVTVRIFNYGANAATNFPVSYKINGGVAVTETVTTSIAGGDSLDYSFIATVNLSTAGSYNFESFTAYSLDGSAVNDSSSIVVNNGGFQLPYFEGFESGLGGWVISGNNPSWAVGAPNSGQINSAGARSSSLVTNLNGPHNDNELSYVTSPCLDFSAITIDPLISFLLNYNIESPFDKLWVEYTIDEGVTWVKVPTNTAASNWYNNTGGKYWTGSNSNWKASESTIPNTAGISKVKIRFVFQSDGSLSFDGVGLDDIVIRERSNIDIKLKSLDSPTNSRLCGYGQNEIITATVINNGISPITSFNAGYQVAGQAVVLQNNITPANPIQPNATYQFTFSQSANLSSLTSYNIDVWAKVAGDGFGLNDSLKNASLPFTSGAIALTPYVENFDGFNATSNAINGSWSRPSTASFQWRVENGQTTSFNTGPAGDHTGGGNYMYTEASPGAYGDTALFESPCIDLSGLNGAVLKFWWHRFGSTMGTLHLDVYNGMNWVNNIAVITATPQTNPADPWVEEKVFLSQFVGSVIKIRFRGIRGSSLSGDMAIDDIEIKEPARKDVKILAMNPSISTSCSLSSNQQLCFDIFNNGLDTINSLSYGFSVNNGQVNTDSISNLQLISGSNAQLCFDDSVDLSNQGIYNFKIWVNILGDTNNFNDTIFQTIEIETLSANFCEDFDSLTEPVGTTGISLIDGKFSNKWKTNDTLLSWEVGNGMNAPGPNRDSSLTGNGKYFVVNENTNYPEPFLISPCIDLNPVLFANLSFTYHQNTLGALYIDVYNGVNWILEVDSIVGNTHPLTSSAWSQKSIDLTNFIGDYINVRFRLDPSSTFYYSAIDNVCVSSVLVGIEEGNNLSNLSIHPNPSLGIFNISINEPINEIEVRDIKGQLIYQNKENQSGSFQLDLSENTKGVYFIQVRNEIGVYNKKVVKQ